MRLGEIVQGLGWGLGLYVSNETTGDSDDAGSWITWSSKVLLDQTLLHSSFSFDF